jgi:hypothetical protein
VCRFERVVGPGKCREPAVDIPAAAPVGAIGVTFLHQHYNGCFRLRQLSFPVKRYEFPHSFREVQENGCPDSFLGGARQYLHFLPM